MELAFGWDFGVAATTATDVLLGEDNAVSIIGDLLVDDGGLSIEHSISWIGDGIEMFQSVSAGNTDAVD